MQKSIYVQKLDEAAIKKAQEFAADSVFVNTGQVTAEDIQSIKEKLSEIKIEGVFTVFEGKHLLEKHPQARAVEVTGKETITNDYHAVSPVNEDVQETIKQNAREVSKLPFDNLWLEHLHFPTKWNVPEPVILDTDYSDYALAKFEEFLGEPIEGANLEEKFLHIDGSYYHEWLRFKAKYINEMAQELSQIFKKDNSNRQIGFFAIPWQDDEYRAGIKRIAAQNFEELLEILDQMAVMMYQKDLDKEINWISETVEYFWHTGTHFLSIIQNDDNIEKLIAAAGKSPAKGVLIN